MNKQAWILFYENVIFKVLGISLLLSGYLISCMAFLYAYFSPTKSAIFSISKSGEANIELIIFIVIGAPLVFYYIITEIAKLKNENTKQIM